MSATGTTRPALAHAMTNSRAAVAPRLLDEVIERTRLGGFDAEAWHVMDRRDNALIEDEILNGAGSSKFVYVLEGMKGEDGKPVSGISVIGARHLAAHYGGIKHRIIAAMRKVGAQVITTSYPAPGVPMTTHVDFIGALADEPDSYTAIIEITDIKTGNSIMVEKREAITGRRRDGSLYERPHYDVIAQSKAYRNGVLAIIPQNVLIQWKLEMLKLDKNRDVITESVIDEKRDGVMQFAAAKGFAIDRGALAGLAMAQIAGLAEAARTKDAVVFARSAISLGLLQESDGAAIPADPPAKGGTPKGAPARNRAAQGIGHPPQQDTAGTAASSTTTEADMPPEPPPLTGEELF